MIILTSLTVGKSSKLTEKLLSSKPVKLGLKRLTESHRFPLKRLISNDCFP